MTCAAVQELYRSNLVCTLIPVLKGVFWFKQYSCTVLGSINFFDCGSLFKLWRFFKVTCAAVQELYRSIWYDCFPS